MQGDGVAVRADPVHPPPRAPHFPQEASCPQITALPAIQRAQIYLLSLPARTRAAQVEGQGSAKLPGAPDSLEFPPDAQVAEKDRVSQKPVQGYALSSSHDFSPAP